MSWKCDNCGACCELLGNYELYEKSIELKGCVYHSDKLCLNYNNRPSVCRTTSLNYSTEQLTNMCSLLKHLNNWHNEMRGLPREREATLKKILLAGII